MKKIIIFIFLLVAVSGCSSSDNIRVPGKKDYINTIGSDPSPPLIPLPAGGIPKSVPNSTSDVTPSRLRTIMAQNGRILTIWALARGNWLWAYGPSSSASFGNVRNWIITQARESGTFKFINGNTGTCIEAHGNGVIHDTCDSNNKSQDFEIIPATNGGVFLKNIVQQRCLRYDIVTHTIYSTVYMTNCAMPGEKTYDQIWYLAPSLTDAFPVN
ncbi:lipoprotein [Salmonella enterica]|uniref:lipoprotein n=1 Tax=Salmonella enterica TaxID=28901 RepID=UPI000FC1A11F|nr:cytolethal distending toxin subunit A [Salmonella enterica]EBE2443169.1 cytolethal distending toxin subunit A [Salmonella enterica subsp. enterica serovar Infantis]EBQ9782972.1 cytolethal distending toxin subunit A [Salmonella enterica subsp. enterica serovar Inganda]EBU7310866.1 cytolethal distending toxin subunit A [Salmonella enterica subsp. enterica serovar Panama]ECC1244802.1 cytolethal distending toxin subunit A [Salmonella enterica subsp. enterica serovar Poona]ECH8971232.1 cytoletha